MIVEKQLAFAQAWMAMFMEAAILQHRLALSLLAGVNPRQQIERTNIAMTRLVKKGLAPVHRKAVSNAKRLARTKLR